MLHIYIYSVYEADRVNRMGASELRTMKGFYLSGGYTTPNG